MIISRRKRKKNKEINVYLNNKSLHQVSTMKYLGILIYEKKFKSANSLPTQLKEATNLYTAYPNQLN